MGKIDYHHTYVDFSKLKQTNPKEGGGTKMVKTCPAAMGFAFAVGTTDSPGVFDFKQGDDRVLKIISFVYFTNINQSDEQNKCQHPKPILLDAGVMKVLYDWAVPDSRKC
ncbi:hypothetical protein FXO37_01682 [Capsicum annuum]|nr:hypothetical protein FXO37_01682 [Capsicum annuum]